MKDVAGGSSFPATGWTLLNEVAAGGAGKGRALEELARRYWKPVYVYLRRKGMPANDADDRTQSFFVHLMEKDLLVRADPARGRFRHWLRALLEHFLANAARERRAEKRGGGKRLLSLDVEACERAFGSGGELSPEEAFQREWALDVLDRALGRLADEFRAAGKEAVIATLRARLGLGEAPAAPANDVALHRARKRLRELILDEVADGVTDRADTASEVADLFRALGRNP